MTILNNMFLYIIFNGSPFKLASLSINTYERKALGGTEAGRKGEEMKI
jgi:hypothetical protein